MRFKSQDGTVIVATVRGIHATTGEVLITDDVGMKRNADPSSMLRVLTDDEKQRLQAAVAAERAAADAVDKPVKYHVAKGYRDATVTVSYEPEPEGQGAWVAEWEGTRFAAETPRELRDAVTVHILQTTYPWSVLFDHPNDDAGRVVPTKDGDQWSGRLFHTREEAEAWLVASKAADEAAWAKARLLAEYAFDLTPYQPGGA